MENFNTTLGIDPAVEITTGELTIGYPTYSVTVINSGEAAATVQGKVMPSGAIWTFAAREGQIYKENKFVFVATGTELTLLINK